MQNCLYYLGQSLWDLTKVLSKYYDLELPTATRVRKAGASTAASTMDRQGVNLLAKQMAHSTQTAERWYQMRATDADSVDAFKKIQRLRTHGTDPAPTAPDSGEQQNNDDGDEEGRGGRIKWTPEQVKVISDFFAGTIQAGQHASISL